MITAAKAGICKIFTVHVSKRLSDQLASDKNVQTDRGFPVFDGLGPACDYTEIYDIDMTAQLERTLVDR